MTARVIDALIDPSGKAAAIAALKSAPPGSRRTDSALASQMLPLIYLGEIERAHDAAQRAVADRSLFTADFLTPDASPNVARFRADPRFQSLVRDTGLLDYWRAVGWPDLCRPLGEGVECD